MYSFFGGVDKHHHVRHIGAPISAGEAGFHLKSQPIVSNSSEF